MKGAFDVTDSAGLVGLARDAASRHRNRKVPVNTLAEALHPDGLHVCAMRFPHNDEEWRTQWICRVLPDVAAASGALPYNHGKDDEGEAMFSVQIWLDVTFEAWEKYVASRQDGIEAQINA